jgi:hypothetical protein
MPRVRLIHGIIHYFGQWISGDERGFRSTHHKIHSSGDYKHPPPRHEHEGLRLWVKSHLSQKPVVLAPQEFPLLAGAFIFKLIKEGSSVRCLSCGPTHMHVLYDSQAADAKDEIGRAKQYASLKLETRPGRIFAKDCDVEEVTLEHARQLWKYILAHERKEGAYIWRYDRDPIPTRQLIHQFLEELKSTMADTTGRRT